jgi:hypothetical protein
MLSAIDHIPMKSSAPEKQAERAFTRSFRDDFAENSNNGTEKDLLS